MDVLPHCCPVVLLEVFGGLLPLSAVFQAIGLEPICSYFWEISDVAIHVALSSFPNAISMVDPTVCNEEQSACASTLIMGGPLGR